jgi:hypothetical protein
MSRARAWGQAGRTRLKCSNYNTTTGTDITVHIYMLRHVRCISHYQLWGHGWRQTARRRQSIKSKYQSIWTKTQKKFMNKWSLHNIFVPFQWVLQCSWRAYLRTEAQILIAKSMNEWAQLPNEPSYNGIVQLRYLKKLEGYLQDM